MRFCQKINCNNEAISRGKYCELHRSLKRNNQFLIEQAQKLKNEQENYLEEERKLKNEQEIEFNNVMEQDRKRFEDLEYENILKLSVEQFYIDKKNNLEVEPTEGEFYTIKIKTPSGKILSRNFNIDSKIKSIRDFLDVYFNENNIDIHNYDIVFNFPVIRVSILDDEKYIKEFSNQKKFMVHIYNKDS